MQYFNEFMRRFHQFDSPIFSTNFSQFASWTRDHQKYSLKQLVDSEFEIGETIRWISYLFTSRWREKILVWIKCINVYIRFHLRCKFQFGVPFLLFESEKGSDKNWKNWPYFSKTNHLKMRLVKYCGIQKKFYLIVAQNRLKITSFCIEFFLLVN